MKFDSNDMKFFVVAAAAAIVLALLLRPVVIAALGNQDVPLPTWASPGRVSNVADAELTSLTVNIKTAAATGTTESIAPASTPQAAPAARQRKLTYYEQTRGTSTRTGSPTGRPTSTASAPPRAMSASSISDRRQPHTSAEFYARSKQKAEAERLTRQVTYWQAEYERMRRDKIYDGLVDTLEKLGKAKADLARVQSQKYIDNLVQQHRQANPTPAPTPRKPTAAEREAAIREKARVEAQKARIYKEEFEKVGLAPPQ